MLWALLAWLFPQPVLHHDVTDCVLCLSGLVDDCPDYQRAYGDLDGDEG